MKNAKCICFRITDPELKQKIWAYRKKHAILISRIGESALRLFFAVDVSSCNKPAKDGG